MLASRAFQFARAKNHDSYLDSESKTPPPRDAFSNWHAIDTKPFATTEPVVIPIRNSHQIPRSEPRKDRRNDMKRHAEKLSDSTRALLADTSIPPPKFSKNAGRRKSGGQRLTVDAVLQHTTVTEKEFSTALRRSSGYMDILLSPPDELEEDDTMHSDAGGESLLSSRTMSTESMPSLDGASLGDASPSFRSSLATPSLRGRKSLPTRSWLSLTSVAARNDALDHPLSSPELDMEGFTFKSSETASLADTSSDTSEVLVLPRRGFKSNITASLRAITMAARSSARSISSFTAPPIMPDDFLHRSIINEPNTIPFTDDRMPPKLLDIPTPELRRYLNPITNAPIQSHVPSSKIQLDGKRVIASMQLRTYRLNRASPSQNHSVISLRTKPAPPELESLFPVVQERGYRDNSDFERRLCFDKLMRRAGKLNEKAPSKAYFSYPPRKQSRSAYKVGANGVPERWVGILPS